MTEENSTQTKGGESQGTHYDYRRRRGMLFGWLAVIVVLVIAFGGLMAVSMNRWGTHEKQNVGMMGRNIGSGQRGSFGRGMMMNQQNRATAKVTAVNGQSFTIDLNGNSKTVLITDTTRFALNSATKVNVGDTVEIQGGQDSNGVIQATLIFVNPIN